MHRSSDTIATIAAALAKAQVELTNPEKFLVCAFAELIATIRRAEKRQGPNSFGVSRLSAPSAPLPHSRIRLGLGGGLPSRG
jgi:hypothetical protein